MFTFKTIKKIDSRNLSGIKTGNENSPFLSSATKKKTLILYTMNEIKGVKAIFDKIPQHLFDQFFAVDNHSTDGTVEYLQSRGIEVIQQRIPGRGAALKEGLDHAIGEIIINLSSDGNEDPETIPKMLEKLEEGYEMVTASRFLPESKVDSSDDSYKIRVFGNKLCAFLVRHFWGSNVTDTTNGLRGFTKHCIEVAKLDYYAYEENFQLAIRCSKLGLPIAEVPTIEQVRAGGVIKAKTSRVFFSLPMVLLKEILIGKRF
jgi:glycosyltransferase involved in cell wall biosynthesis